MEDRPVICFVTGSRGDWGGAGRVIFALLRTINRERLEPLILLPRKGPIQKELEVRGLRYLIWGELTELASPWQFAKAFVRTLRFLRRERVRLVHINHHLFWRPAEVLAAYVLRIPVIARCRVINDTPAPFLELCRAAVGVSRYHGTSLPDDLENSPVIYDAISLDRFDAAGRCAATSVSPDDVVVASSAGSRRRGGRTSSPWPPDAP